MANNQHFSVTATAAPGTLIGLNREANYLHFNTSGATIAISLDAGAGTFDLPAGLYTLGPIAAIKQFRLIGSGTADIIASLTHE